MATEMKRMSATADAHIRRDVAISGKWVCECEPCREVRSLIGIDKMVNVRPLVREIEQIEEQMCGLSEGPERRSLLERYLTLYDKLAEVMAE